MGRDEGGGWEAMGFRGEDGGGRVEQRMRQCFDGRHVYMKSLRKGQWYG